MTSTLQQEASRKLRFSAQTTMRVAQRLYENGYIVHADRFDDPVGVGARGGTFAGPRAVRRGLRSRAATAVRAQGEERAGGARGDSPVGRHVPHAEGRAERAQPR